MSDVPFVAIGAGEEPPWSHLDLSCPTCGEEDLPLFPSNPPMLFYIKHCGDVWVRGPLRMYER